MEQFTKECQWCEEPFQTEHESKAYCSRYHKERARQQRKTINSWSKESKYFKIYPRHCLVCQETYIARREHSSYCSEDCKKFVKKEKKRQREEEYYRRAKGVRSKLYFRDKGLCQICFEPILLSISYPDTRSLSIDHIIPISKGGTSAMGNLQVTHLKCNMLKKDTLDFIYKHDLDAETEDA